MPYLNKPRVQRWLVDHDKSVRDLAAATGIPAMTIKNAVLGGPDPTRGRDPIRWGRVRLLSTATGQLGKAIAVPDLVAPGTALPEFLAAGGEGEGDGDAEVKKETTGPKRRENGGGTGPKRPAGRAA
jgi:hypothetical protein